MTLTEIPAPYGTDLWQVARVDTAYLDEAQRAELFGWLTDLGIAYRQCRPTLAISQDAPTRQLLLHLSRFVLDASGEKITDHAANRVHVEPVVYAVTDYPAWLVEVSQQQQKEADDGALGTD